MLAQQYFERQIHQGAHLLIGIYQSTFLRKLTQGVYLLYKQLVFIRIGFGHASIILITFRP